MIMRRPVCRHFCHGSLSLAVYVEACLPIPIDRDELDNLRASTEFAPFFWTRSPCWTTGVSQTCCPLVSMAGHLGWLQLRQVPLSEPGCSQRQNSCFSISAVINFIASANVALPHRLCMIQRSPSSLSSPKERPGGLGHSHCNDPCTPRADHLMVSALGAARQKSALGHVRK